MFSMLENLLKDFINAINDFISGMMVQMLENVFYPENSMNIGGVTMNLAGIFNIFMSIGLSLITLKFLKKGFDIYIGWVDGDKDNDVGHLLLNYGRAMVTVFAFRYIYEFLVNVISSLLLTSMSALTAGAIDSLGLGGLATTMLALADTNIISTIIILILLIMILIIYFRLLVMGLQLLALRIAFPIACVGLIDSDKGIFKSFFQKFIMISVSAFVMVFFLRFAIFLIMSGFGVQMNQFWAMAAGMAAMKTPDLLRDFMLGYGGSGGGVSRAMQMAHATSSVNRSVRAFLKK